MQSFLQLRLGCHCLPWPIAAGRLAAAGHVLLWLHALVVAGYAESSLVISML